MHLRQSPVDTLLRTAQQAGGSHNCMRMILLCVLLAATVNSLNPKCVAPELRIGCPANAEFPGDGATGCASRLCCFDSTAPEQNVSCSHYNQTKPPAPPKSPVPSSPDSKLIRILDEGHEYIMGVLTSAAQRTAKKFNCAIAIGYTDGNISLSASSRLGGT